MYLFLLHSCLLRTFHVPIAGNCFLGEPEIKSHLCIQQTFIEHSFCSWHWGCKEDKKNVSSLMGEAVISPVGQLQMCTAYFQQRRIRGGFLEEGLSGHIFSLLTSPVFYSFASSWWSCHIFYSSSAPRLSLIYINYIDLLISL